MLRRVALVTSREHPELPADDRPLIAELGRLGIAASAQTWDDPSVFWAAFDAIVLRSTWDYHLRIDAFRRWIAARATEGAALWNPADLLLWNTHKFYLRELEAGGVPIIPTRFVPAPSGGMKVAAESRAGKVAAESRAGRNAPPDVARILEEEGWTRAVVKPAVSGGAWRTHLVDRAAASRLPETDPALGTDDILVQQYLPEIESGGEWSLVYIDGAFSHAVRKRPASGDFRVQTELGGTFAAARPDPALVRQADRILAAIDSPWLYARVDGVAAEDRLLLMELEVVEPSLFLDAAPDAVRRFAAAIDRAAAEGSHAAAEPWVIEQG
jgi:glutathione synthase/RimK-type ligase-like ATP-grasp enzyme